MPVRIFAATRHPTIARDGHFLAWDFPHINDLVINMEPQTYSFSDLVRLTCRINDDASRYVERHAIDEPAPTIGGGCNHWAGNSIYHQHYQFFRSADLPILREYRFEHLASYGEVRVEVAAVDWPSTTLRISGPRRAVRDLMQVADRVAREWIVLNDGEDESLGNGISIKLNTHNTFVTCDEELITAFFVPRRRDRRDTQSHFGLRKTDAGFLEMLGYFIIDDEAQFSSIQELAEVDRHQLAQRWLGDLSPERSMVAEFLANVRLSLSIAVVPYEAKLEELLNESDDELRNAALRFAMQVHRDHSLSAEERELIYREIIWACTRT